MVRSERIMKRLISALALITVLCVPALALSDSEYLEMKKDPAFRAADTQLTRAYNQAKNSMSKSDFEKLRREQRKWIESGRDSEAKSVMRNRNPKLFAYTHVTLERARKIYSAIPPDSYSSLSVSADDFIGTYYNSNHLCLVIWRDNSKKQKLCVGFNEPRKNSPDMFGYPDGNVLEVEFDYNDEDLMSLVKYENGIEEEGNLDLRAKLTMLNEDTIKMEASPDIERLFGQTSGIFIKGHEDNN